MDETTQIKVILKRFECIRNPTVYLLTVKLGVNSTNSIMTMDKSFIKGIKEIIGYLIGPNGTTAYRMEFGLQTMQAIDLSTS